MWYVVYLKELSGTDKHSSGSFASLNLQQAPFVPTWELHLSQKPLSFPQVDQHSCSLSPHPSHIGISNWSKPWNIFDNYCPCATEFLNVFIWKTVFVRIVTTCAISSFKLAVVKPMIFSRVVIVETKCVLDVDISVEIAVPVALPN